MNHVPLQIETQTTNCHPYCSSYTVYECWPCLVDVGHIHTGKVLITPRYTSRNELTTSALGGSSALGVVGDGVVDDRFFLLGLAFLPFLVFLPFTFLEARANATSTGDTSASSTEASNPSGSWRAMGGQLEFMLGLDLKFQLVKILQQLVYLEGSIKPWPAIGILGP